MLFPKNVTMLLVTTSFEVIECLQEIALYTGRLLQEFQITYQQFCETEQVVVASSKVSYNLVVF